MNYRESGGQNLGSSLITLPVGGLVFVCDRGVPVRTWNNLDPVIEEPLSEVLARDKKRMKREEVLGPTYCLF